MTAAPIQTPPASDDRPAFGEVLIGLGLIDPEALERGLRAQADHDERIGTILTKLGLISDTARAKALSVQFGLPLAGPEDFPETAVDIGPCSVAFLREFKVVPLAADAESLSLAMADPANDYVLKVMGLRTGRAVHPQVASESDIETAFERLYRNGESALDSLVETIGAQTSVEGDDDIERLKDLASEAPVIRLVNLLIGRAVEARASDIHIEPFEARLAVRYRVDGMLREVEAPPGRLAPAVISRIKIMARLDIAERRLPQDGRIRLRLNDRELDLRVATTPSLHGEAVVIRLLEHQPVALDFQALGFPGASEEPFLAALGEHHGIVLVTGPTGSGKTTTLYAALSHLNTRDRKIITVEDPVEYELEGVTQIPVNSKIDLSFAKVLRSIVRQDPDVIMVGEMRDLETAEIAVQSALTGHLVLSTLHTNDAPSAVTRLLDMGVEDFLLTSTVNAVLAQRLVRRLCPDCREPWNPPDELVERFQLRRYAGEGPVVLHRAVGCKTCGQLGYSGRLGIFELLSITDPLRQLVLKRADAATIQAWAKESGMESMFEDGLRKAVAGDTTIEEVRRVSRER